MGRRSGAEAVQGLAVVAGGWLGYAGPPDRKAAEVVSKYIIVDMYAKAVQGMPAEDAVKWAEGEIRSIAPDPPSWAGGEVTAPGPAGSGPKGALLAGRANPRGRQIFQKHIH